MNLKHSLICIALISIIVGCHRQSEPTVSLTTNENGQVIGRKLNSLRRELGLREISDRWILYRSDNRQEDWKNSSAGAIAKTVLKDGNGNVTQEVDSYYSGAEFEGPDGHNWENIGVIYDYKTKEVAISYAGPNKAIEASLLKYKMTIHGGSINVSDAIAEVNKIVAGWPGCR